MNKFTAKRGNLSIPKARSAFGAWVRFLRGQQNKIIDCQDKAVVKTHYVKYWLVTFISCFFSMPGFAEDGPMSFTPPTTDISVIFLGDIFGVVDGVLYGSGSQIMGAIFTVLNSAVLAVGGIIVMYTLIVGTLNTANEGKMLGQKWASMWVPIRATIGLALMMPKASGYCLMQVFVMWVVVQGVGAADKIWNTALDYLTRGGSIVLPQTVPTVSLNAGGSTSSSSVTSVQTLATNLLQSQVCMAGLQTLLETQREAYLTNAQSGSGPCYNVAQGSSMYDYCNDTVPDFISSVDFVSYQTSQYQNQSASDYCSTASSPTSLTMSLPNFPSTGTNAIYKNLNGVCGSVQWTPYSITQFGSCSSTGVFTPSISGVSAEAAGASVLSIATALQQLYVSYTYVANAMVGNDPQITINNNAGSSTDWFSSIAIEQYGAPYVSPGVPCPTVGSDCPLWSPVENSSGQLTPVIFTGTEYQDGIAAYNAVMEPTLNLISQGGDAVHQSKILSTLQGAQSCGWLSAGSYFFGLVNVSGPAMSSNATQTTNWPVASFNTSYLTCSFPPVSSSPSCVNLSSIFNANETPINNLLSLIGTSTGGSTSTQAAVTGSASSTTSGYLTNAALLTLPQQAGIGQDGNANISTLNKMNFHLTVGNASLGLPDFSYHCGNPSIWTGCMFEALAKNLMEDIIFVLIGWIVDLLAEVANMLLQLCLAIPLTVIGWVFEDAVKIIEDTQGNPIQQLASMGCAYINFAMDLWMDILEIGMFCAFFPPLAILFSIMMSLLFPLLMAWLGIMLSIGFVTAYYIPFLPYMMFTFGGISWIMLVIEAMVAAPIVALGITHPDGPHDAFGKGEAGLMILLNIFLRPAMMIIGYITAIALSYVAVWILNTGFGNVDEFIQGNGHGTGGMSMKITYNFQSQPVSKTPENPKYYSPYSQGDLMTGYSSWAGIYGLFFSVLMYTTLYMIVVQKSFELIWILPDKVLRWIGQSPEDAGQRSAQWGEEAKGKIEKGGEATIQAGGQMQKKLGAMGEKAISAVSKSGGGEATASAPPE